MSHVSAEVGLAMQVHIEGTHVKKRKVEILSWWIVDISEQCLRRYRLRPIVNISKESFDSSRTMPTHHARWNFVAECHKQRGGMCRQRTDLVDNASPDRTRRCTVVKKGHMLGPRNPDNHVQPGSCSFIQKVTAGHCVGAHGVDTTPRHQRKVVSNLGKRR